MYGIAITNLLIVAIAMVSLTIIILKNKRD